MNSRDLDPIITQQYILQMRPVFNKDALFSDGSKYYRIPMEPEIGEEVKIRFRTLRNNVDNVYLIHDHEATQMYISRTDKGFDYYTAKISWERKSAVIILRFIPGSLPVITTNWGSVWSPKKKMLL